MIRRKGGEIKCNCKHRRGGKQLDFLNGRSKTIVETVSNPERYNSCLVKRRFHCLKRGDFYKEIDLAYCPQPLRFFIRFKFFGYQEIAYAHSENAGANVEPMCCDTVSDFFFRLSLLLHFSVQTSKFPSDFKHRWSIFSIHFCVTTSKFPSDFINRWSIYSVHLSVQISNFLTDIIFHVVN